MWRSGQEVRERREMFFDQTDAGGGIVSALSSGIVVAAVAAVVVVVGLRRQSAVVIHQISSVSVARLRTSRRAGGRAGVQAGV